MTVLNTVNPKNETFNALGLQQTVGNGKGEMGQADFLRLMTEQLKNQDPLKPLSNTEFLGQLAQFSTVQGIQELNTSFAGMANSLGSDQALRGAELIGYTALVPSDQIAIPEASINSDGSRAARQVEGVAAAPGAGPIVIDIKDASGQLVRRITVQANGTGDVPFVWDGLDEQGVALPAGTYNMNATYGQGTNVQQVGTGVVAKIESITLSPQGLILNFAGIGSAPLSAVLRIG